MYLPLGIIEDSNVMLVSATGPRTANNHSRNKSGNTGVDDRSQEYEIIIGKKRSWQ